jgi:hypothetical protein
MEYPSDFPAELQPAVDAKFHQAERDFIDARKLLKHSFEMDGLIINYIQKVFTAFALQACRAEERGLWSGQKVRRAMEEFRRRLTVHVFFDKHPNPRNSSALDDLQRDAKRTKEKSDDWREIQEELQRVARLRAVEAENIRLFPGKAVLKISGGTPVVTLTEDGAPKRPEPKTRTIREPKLDLLTNPDAYLSRKKAALALGVSERTVDRYSADGRLIRHLTIIATGLSDYRLWP